METIGQINQNHFTSHAFPKFEKENTVALNQLKKKKIATKTGIMFLNTNINTPRKLSRLKKKATKTTAKYHDKQNLDSPTKATMLRIQIGCAYL